MRNLLVAVPAIFMAAAPLAAQAQSYEVLFAHDSAALDDAARAVIADAAQSHAATGSSSITVRGHTDTSGNADYNAALSKRRASAVAEELAARGVPVSQISASFVGENDLAIETGDGVRERSNRRVTINLDAPAAAPAAAPVVLAPARSPFSVSVGPYVGFNGQDGNNSGSSSVFIGGNLTLGYDVTPNVRLSIEQAVFADTSADDNGIGGRTAFGADYIFGGGDISPYVGANIGAIYTDSSFDDEFFAGPEIGVRFGMLEAKAAYDMPFDRDIEDGVISLTIGASLRF